MPLITLSASSASQVSTVTDHYDIDESNILLEWMTIVLSFAKYNMDTKDNIKYGACVQDASQEI